MRIEVIKDLVKVADSLDRKGLYKESDMVDALIQKMAGGVSLRDFPGRGDFSPSGHGDNEPLSEDEKEIIMKKVKDLVELHLEDDPRDAMAMREALDSGALRELHELVNSEIAFLEELLAAIKDADSQLHEISVLE